MSKDATQKGVSDPNAISEEQQQAVDEARQNTLKTRTGDINDLAEARKEERDAELEAEGITPEDTSGKEDQSDDDKDDGKDDDKKEDIKADDENNVETPDEFVTLTIDGKETQVSKSKIIDAGTRTLQKEATADVRLEEATRILNEAKKVTEGSGQPSNENADVDDTADRSEVDLEALAKSLVNGDVDEVAEAIGTIMGTGRQDEMATQAVKMQPNDVYGMVEGALQMKEAMDTFQKSPDEGGYGDLYSDETTRQMVFDKEAELAKDETSGSPSVRLEKAAKEVREWRNNLIEQSGGKVVNFGDRSNKKADAKSTPNSAGGRTPEQQDEQPKSEADKRREALNKMARSRGQHLD